MLKHTLMTCIAIFTFTTVIDAKADSRLLGHWKLDGDGTDSSEHQRHVINHNVRFDAPGLDGQPGNVAVFDGTTAYLETPADSAPSLGSDDFTIAVRLHTDDDLADLPGEIISQFDEQTRTGFRLGIDSRPGVTSSQANFRNLHFGIDSGSTPGEWTDHGRLGNAVLVFAMTVHDGQLFAGTCVPGRDDSGRVFRYDGRNWYDCGSPDDCNSVSSLAVHDGQLYAASSRYRLGGSALTESENPHDGGSIYRYEQDNQWVNCGRLPDTSAIHGLVSFNGQLFASSMYAPAGCYRYEGGTEWKSLGVPSGKRVESLTVHNGSIYATGYDEGAVYRLDGERWEHLGVIEGANQTYGFATYGGELYVSEWPNARVFRHGGGSQWHPAGRLGEEMETMPMVVYNGKMYAGTLPTGEVHRFDGPVDPADSTLAPVWTKIARLDHTPGVRYRRVWSMAVYQGRLFAGTLPSGKVHSIEIGRNVTHDQELTAGWHHVAATREKDRLRLYVDGRLVASSSRGACDLNLTNEQPLRIGFGTTDYFRGRMSDLRIYNTALSADKLRTLADETR